MDGTHYGVPREKEAHTAVHPHPYQSEGADTVTDRAPSHRFGQPIPPHRLSSLARQMAAAIGDGTPAPWAGFVWQHPDGRIRQGLLTRVKYHPFSEAA
jgi:hypothetical protein